MLIAASIALVFVYLFNTTSYSIQGNFLFIRCGFSFNKKADVQNIARIKPSRSPLSSPSASIDRLEIRFGKSGFVLISPLDKKGFIATLLEINPSINTIV